MPPNTQGFRHPSAAARTGLGGVTRVDFLYPATSVCSFVAENIEEATPCGIVNRFSQPGFGQPFDIQIFDGEMLGFRQDPVRLSVKEVAPASRQLAVEFSQCSDRFSPSGATFVLASDGALQYSQSLLPFTEKTRRFDDCSVRTRDQGIQPHINTQRVDDRRGFSVGGFDRKTDKPVTPTAGNFGVFDFPLVWDCPMPPNLDPAGDADDPQAVPVQAKAIAKGKFSRIPPAAGLKAWKPGFLTGLQPTEEGAKGFVQPPQDVLLGAVAPAGELRAFQAQDLEFSGLCAISEVDAFAVGVDPAFQRRVVETAKIPQQCGQRRRLRGTRVETVFEGAQHLLPFLTFDVAPDRGFGHRPHCGSEVGARPQCGKTGAQKREFLPQNSAAHPFQSVDQFCYTQRRPGFDEQVNVNYPALKDGACGCTRTILRRHRAPR